MNALITRVWSNKHTSGAAVVYVAAKYGSQLLNIWFPGHEQQLSQTEEIVTAAAVAYGLIMAGDSKPVVPDAPPTPTKEKTA